MIGSEVEKIFMNSLFGKTLQDDARFRDVNFAFTDDQLLTMVDDEENVLINMDILRTGDCARLISQFIGPEKKRDLFLRTMSPVGVAILAWARTYMAIFYADLVRHVPNVRPLYTDTDSFYLAFPQKSDWDAFQQHMGPRYLGNEKLMHFKAESAVDKIRSFCATTPKCYAMQLEPDGDTPAMSIDYVGYYKVKGVSQRYNSHLLTFEAYVKQVFDPTAEPLIGSSFTISQRKPLQLYSQHTSKVVLTNRLSKRGWIQENPIFTYPYGHYALKTQV